MSETQQLIDVDAYASQNKEFKGVVTLIANTAKDKVSTDAITEFEVRILILEFFLSGFGECWKQVSVSSGYDRQCGYHDHDKTECTFSSTGIGNNP